MQTERPGATTYELTRHVIGPRTAIPLTADGFARLAAAREGLVKVITIEEEWDVLVEDFADLHLAMISTAARDMLFSGETYDTFHRARLTFVRRLSALLSSARMYLDHAPHHMKRLPDGAAISTDQFKVLTSEQYDASFAYRFMEALRNYVQHRGLPIHSTRYDRQWIEREDNKKGLLRHSVAAFIDPIVVKNDEKFKKSVAAELGDGLEKLDVMPVAAEYLEGLSRVHMALRERLKPYIDDWKRTIVQAIADYEAVADDDEGATGLEARKRENERTIERVPVLASLADTLDDLQRKNRSLVNLRKRYVTTEPSVRG